MEPIGVFPKCFNRIQLVITVKGLEPVRDQVATTDPTSLMWQTGS